MKFILKLKEEVNLDSFNEKHKLNATILENLNFLIYENENVDTVVDKLSKLNDVERIEKDHEVTSTEFSIYPFVPDSASASIEKNDVATQDSTILYTNTTAGQLELISTLNYDENKSIHRYPTTETGENADIYILDTGVNFNHVDLIGRVNRVPGFNLNLEGMNDDDNKNHGTYSALCAAGKGQGTAQDARIFSCKVLGQSGSGSFSNIISAINSVISHHKSKSSTNESTRPSIINLSLSSSLTSGSTIVYDATGINNSLFYDVMKVATSNGVHVVASAGNGFYQNNTLYGPHLSRYKNGVVDLTESESGTSDPGQGVPIIVGATESRTSQSSFYSYNIGHMANFSNYGMGTTISGPGKNVVVRNWSVSTEENNADQFMKINGTSFSGPLTAGLVALHACKNTDPHDTINVRKKLLDTATKNNIKNLSKPIFLNAGEYTFSFNSDGTGVLILNQRSWNNQELVKLTKIVKLNGQNKVNEDVLEVGDLIQISFDQKIDHESEYSNHYEYIAHDSTSLTVKFPSSDMPGAIEFSNLKMSIAVIENTHEATDGVIEYKRRNPAWSGLGRQKINSNGQLIFENFIQKTTEYTDDYSLFNPYQAYEIFWNNTTNSLIFDYANENSTSILSADIKTLVFGETPFETKFTLKSGKLPSAWNLNKNGKFELNMEFYDDTEQHDSQIIVIASNGYNSEEFTKTFSISSIKPEIDFELKNSLNLGWFENSENYDLASNEGIELVYGYSESGKTIVSWSPKIHTDVIQPMQSLNSNKMYLIKKNENSTLTIDGFNSSIKNQNTFRVGISAINKSNQFNSRYNLVWFGECGSIPSNFSLNDQSIVSEAYKFTDLNSINFVGKWIKNDNENSTIDFLEYGCGYILKVSETIEINEFVEHNIPNLVNPFNDTGSSKQCLEYPPPTPTPTPSFVPMYPAPSFTLDTRKDDTDRVIDVFPIFSGIPSTASVTLQISKSSLFDLNDFPHDNGITVTQSASWSGWFPAYEWMNAADGTLYYVRMRTNGDSDEPNGGGTTSNWVQKTITTGGLTPNTDIKIHKFVRDDGSDMASMYYTAASTETVRIEEANNQSESVWYDSGTFEMRAGTWVVQFQTSSNTVSNLDNHLDAYDLPRTHQNYTVTGTTVEYPSRSLRVTGLTSGAFAYSNFRNSIRVQDDD